MATNLQGTAGTWASSSARTASGETQLIASNGATFYLTGVCLNVGDSAIDFPHESYGETLAKCQRYYQQMSFSECYMNPQQTAATMDFTFPTEMRASPTTTTTNGFGVGTVTQKNAFVFRTLSAGVYATTVTVDAEL